MCRHGLWIQRRDSLTFNSFNNLHCVVIFVSFLATFWGSATMSWAAPVNFCLQLHHSTAPSVPSLYTLDLHIRELWFPTRPRPFWGENHAHAAFTSCRKVRDSLGESFLGFCSSLLWARKVGTSLRLQRNGVAFWRAFKQEIDSCFQFVNDAEERKPHRKQLNAALKFFWLVIRVYPYILRLLLI